MTTVKITRIFRESKTSASGKPYTSLQMYTQEHGDQRLSGFGNQDNASWNVGDTVDIDIKEVQKGDKTYLNFETPKSGGIPPSIGLALGRIEEVVNRMDARLAHLQGVATSRVSSDEPDDDEIPY